MANAVRFATPELLETEGRIASASERALNLEQEIFADLAETHRGGGEHALGAAAAALAELDVVAALAQLALEQGYARPIVDRQSWHSKSGADVIPSCSRHWRRAEAAAFIENDCVLGRSGIERAAGIRRASGSAHLARHRTEHGRQVDVPAAECADRGHGADGILRAGARRAHIGVVDRLFSRVGASDDLARGRSTFMVEMVETAAILNQATERSLVILDEIGRGTATFDGLSIAWATVEYLHDVTKARALFATHYHELTALARRLDGIANVTMDVTEWQDTIVFLHKVKAGRRRSLVRYPGRQARRPSRSRRRAGARGSRRFSKRPIGVRAPATTVRRSAAFFGGAAESGAATSSAAVAVEKVLDAMHPDELSPQGGAREAL